MPPSVDWDARAIDLVTGDSLSSGVTYLSVYSQIYSQTEHRKEDLTATVSMRNTSQADTLFIEKADYFDTHGKLIREYVGRPVFLTPLETLEIVVNQHDREGGTGGNFIFHWKIHFRSPEPLFEGIMISTSGQQGLSFSTKGKRIQ